MTNNKDDCKWQIHVVDDWYICAHSPVDQLLLALAAQLMKQINLKDSELFAVKALLVKKAETMSKDDYLEIGESGGGKTLARIGRDVEGTVLLWHTGLPWPSFWSDVPS